MTDWSDPQTLWVNLTNLGLGLVTLVCIVVVGVSIARELLARARAKARAAAWEDDHAFAIPGLGWTMADGGERKSKDKNIEKKRRRPGVARTEAPMRCPFLREAQVKSCQASPHKKMILRLPKSGAQELCSSPAHVHCVAARENHEERPDPGRCAFLAESLVQYCAAAPVATYVPYSESSMSRCGGDTHRYCDLFLAFAPAGGDTRPAIGEVEVPRALWYAKNHLWLDVGADGACHVGIDALLARVLGNVDRVTFTTEKGSRRPSAVLSVRGADVTVIFPNTFRLTATNPALRAHPERLVEDPYGTGWLFEGYDSGATATESLLPGERAFEWMRGEVGRLDAFVHAALSRPGADGVRLVADGGSFARGLFRELGPEERLALLDGFFTPEIRP